MSDPAEDPSVKAGHAPAVKVGGMRVVTHTKAHKEKPAEEEKPDEEEEFEVPPKTDKHHQQILLSGVVTKGDKDFPEAAVKSYHEKPKPTHENRHVNSPQMRVIQQPRK